eukprot:m.308199 g.308199  ORF g.308199 m.308199 type:complete len:61 (-) comp27403_c0_seq1:129-311(-)
MAIQAGLSRVFCLDLQSTVLQNKTKLFLFLSSQHPFYFHHTAHVFNHNSTITAQVHTTVY